LPIGGTGCKTSQGIPCCISALISATYARLGESSLVAVKLSDPKESIEQERCISEVSMNDILAER
jgi:hypothetical protein